MANTFTDRFRLPSRSLTESSGDGQTVRPGAAKALQYKARVSCQEQNIVVEAWLPETVNTDINAQYDQPFAQGLNEAFPRLGSMARFVGVNLTTQALTTQVWNGGSLISFSIPFVFRAETSAAKDVIQPIKDLMRLIVPKDSAENGGGLLKAPGPHLDLQRLGSAGREAISSAPGKIVSAAISDLPKSDQEKVKSGNLIDSTLGSLGSALVNGVERAERAGNAASQSLSNAIVNSIKNNISLEIGRFLYFPCVVVKDVSPQYDVVMAPDSNPHSVTVTVNFETLYIPTDRDIKDMFPMALPEPSTQIIDRPTRGGR